MKEKREKNEMPAHELPWPKELSFGLSPGLIWAGSVFVLLLIDWRLGVLSLVGMLAFFYSQRQTPVGRARGNYVQGRLAYRRGDLREALQSFKKTIEILPAVAVLYSVAGDTCFQLAEIAEAKKLYNRYFQLEPGDDQMRIWYAGKLMEQGLFSEAGAELQKLQQETRQALEIANLAAVCALKSENSSEAAVILVRAGAARAGAGEHELTARYLLAKAYLKCGETEKARRILLRLEQDRPGFEDVAEIISSLKKL